MTEKQDAAKSQARSTIDDDPADLVGLTADVVSAYVSNNSVAVGDLPGLVASVHGALANLGQPLAPAEAFSPAVPVKKSVTADALVSLIDGKSYRTLKRHLASHGLTPAEYRQRYKLPTDYPMVAANYAAKRSELARSLGLGLQRKAAAKAVASDPVVKSPVKVRSAR